MRTIIITAAIFLALAAAACGDGDDDRVEPTIDQTIVPPGTWEISVPEEPVAVGETVQVGIRNADGQEGQTFSVQLFTRTPLGPSKGDTAEVKGDQWTYLDFSETSEPGTHLMVFTSLEPEYAGIVLARASFEVEGPADE